MAAPKCVRQQTRSGPHPAALSSAARVSQVSSLPLAAMFGMCALFLLVCAACQRRLEYLVHAGKSDPAAPHLSIAALLAEADGASPPPQPKASWAEDGLP